MWSDSKAVRDKIRTFRCIYRRAHVDYLTKSFDGTVDRVISQEAESNEPVLRRSLEGVLEEASAMDERATKLAEEVTDRVEQETDSMHWQLTEQVGEIRSDIEGFLGKVSRPSEVALLANAVDQLTNSVGEHVDRMTESLDSHVSDIADSARQVISHVKKLESLSRTFVDLERTTAGSIDMVRKSLRQLKEKFDESTSKLRIIGEVQDLQNKATKRLEQKVDELAQKVSRLPTSLPSFDGVEVALRRVCDLVKARHI